MLQFISVTHRVELERGSGRGCCEWVREHARRPAGMFFDAVGPELLLIPRTPTTKYRIPPGGHSWRHHSITSSARASTMSGMSRPSALAVFRLMTVSYFVGA